MFPPSNHHQLLWFQYQIRELTITQLYKEENSILSSTLPLAPIFTQLLNPSECFSDMLSFSNILVLPLIPPPPCSNLRLSWSFTLSATCLSFCLPQIHLLSHRENTNLTFQSSVKRFLFSHHLQDKVKRHLCGIWNPSLRCPLTISPL